MKGKGKLPLKAYKGHLLWSVRGHARRMANPNPDKSVVPAPTATAMMIGRLKP